LKQNDILKLSLPILRIRIYSKCSSISVCLLYDEQDI
jgi:hypothetical protein